MSIGNEPAFPLQPGKVLDRQGVQFWQNGQEGLTKREYFAGLAMQGLLSSHEIIRHFNKSAKKSSGLLPAAAVKYADALILELGKETK
jgi:hypothetical protein